MLFYHLLIPYYKKYPNLKKLPEKIEDSLNLMAKRRLTALSSLERGIAEESNHKKR